MLQKIKKLTIPFYPFLMGPYAVLLLWSANIGQVTASTTFRSLLAALIVSAIIFLVSLIIIRKIHKSAFIAAMFSFLLFFYGLLFSIIDQKEILGFVYGRHRYLLPLLVGLLVFGMVKVIISRNTFAKFTRLMNFLISVVIIISLIPIINYEIRYARNMYSRAPSAAETVQADPNLPDVYFIVLDGYTRSDVLLTEYNYDNSPFINELKEIGFYVPECAFSNYYTTTASISSILNMDYVDALGISDEEANKPFSTSMNDLVINSQARAIFESMGYKTVAFRGYLPAQDIKNADYYYNLQETLKEKDLIGLHTFERILMRSTVLRLVIEQYEVNPTSLDILPAWMLSAIDLNSVQSKDDPGSPKTKEEQWYQQSSYQFEVMKKLPDIGENIFVYSHIYSTHIPFVFDEFGNQRIMDANNEIYYVPALKHAEKEVLNIIRTIIRKSDVPPVIILQGDHGKLTGLNHNKILNAYYLPGQDYSDLPGTITPVNTFRIVLNKYFGGDYALLPDEIMTKNNGEIVHEAAECGLK